MLFLTWRILQFVVPIILRSLRITTWSRFFVALLNHMQNYSTSMCEYMLFSFWKLCSRIYIIFEFRKSCICTLRFFLLEECFDFSSLLLWGVWGFSPRGNYKMTCQINKHIFSEYMFFQCWIICRKMCIIFKFWIICSCTFSEVLDSILVANIWFVWPR